MPPKIDNTKKVKAPDRRLDDLARLLEGNGICCSVSYVVDPKNRRGTVVIAHNNSSDQCEMLVRSYFAFFRNRGLQSGKDLVKNLANLVLDSLALTNQGDISALKSPRPGAIRDSKGILEARIAIYVRALCKVYQNLDNPEIAWSQALRGEGRVTLIRTEGGKLQHAELKVILRSLADYSVIPPYLGISKLCCAVCEGVAAKLYGREISEGPYFARGGSGASFPMEISPELLEELRKVGVKDPAGFIRQLSNTGIQPAGLDYSQGNPLIAERSQSRPRDIGLIKEVIQEVVHRLGYGLSVDNIIKYAAAGEEPLSLAFADSAQRGVNRYGIQLRDVPGDGHCFYHAIHNQFPAQTADQIYEAAIAHLLANPTLYQAFIPEEHKEDPAAAINRYASNQLLEGAWADEIMIQATANALNRNITTVLLNQDGTVHQVIETTPSAGASAQTLCLVNLNNVHFYSAETTAGVDISESIRQIQQDLGRARQDIANRRRVRVRRRESNPLSASERPQASAQASTGASRLTPTSLHVSGQDMIDAANAALHGDLGRAAVAEPLRGRRAAIRPEVPSAEPKGHVGNEANIGGYARSRVEERRKRDRAPEDDQRPRTRPRREEPSGDIQERRDTRYTSRESRSLTHAEQRRSSSVSRSRSMSGRDSK